MAGLGACPLCRTAIDAESAAVCPGCGADLSPYRTLLDRAGHYLDLAGELIVRGETGQARLVLEQVQQIADLDPGTIAVLQARLELAEGNLEAASETLAQLKGRAADELEQELKVRLELRRTARELYNYALNAARQGQFEVAAEALARSVRHDPQDAELWKLKLKADLKCGRFERCYRDLAALDAMKARPSEYACLEELLPPVI